LSCKFKIQRFNNSKIQDSLFIPLRRGQGEVQNTKIQRFKDSRFIIYPPSEGAGGGSKYNY
jgi:hypothetical protein